MADQQLKRSIILYNEKLSKSLVTSENQTSTSFKDDKSRLSAKEKGLKNTQPQPEAKERKRSLLPSFADMQVMVLKLAKRVHSKHSDLSFDTVLNIVTYAKQLPQEAMSDHIDDCIFKSQMYKHFDITNPYMLDRMYDVAAGTDRNPKLTVAEYADLICMFISSDLSPKIDFVFKVYDKWGEGQLSRKHIRHMVRPMVQHVEYSEESDDTLNYLTNLLMDVMDIDKNDYVDLEEFHHLVKVNKRILMLECFGVCLPDEKYLDIFKGKVVDKNNIEVAGMFRNERKRSLRDPNESHLKVDIFTQQYGIKLDLP